MNHLEFGKYESDSLNPTPWEEFVSRCEKLCERHLHLDHLGKPSFDGDDDIEGYSFDWLHEQWKAGKRPIDVKVILLWRKLGLHTNGKKEEVKK